MKEKKQREPHDKAFITAGLFLGSGLVLSYLSLLLAPNSSGADLRWLTALIVFGTIISTVVGIILFIIHICKTHQYWAFTFIASIALIVAVPFLVYAETAFPNRAKLFYNLSQIALRGAGVIFLVGAIWWSVDQMKKRHKKEEA